jgi:hypothetical protein
VPQRRPDWDSSSRDFYFGGIRDGFQKKISQTQAEEAASFPEDTAGYF